MSDMVERVARALCGEDSDAPVSEVRNGVGLVGTSVLWEHHTDDARTFLAALNEAGYVIVPREPTDEMVERMERGLRTWFGDGGDWLLAETHEEAVDVALRGIIVATLAD